MALNTFNVPPARNNIKVVSSIYTPDLLNKISGDVYFPSIDRIARVDIFYGHTGDRQLKQIIHKAPGLSGEAKWSNFAKSGIWRKNRVMVYDTDGAVHELNRSDIGAAEDLTIA